MQNRKKILILNFIIICLFCWSNVVCSQNGSFVVDNFLTDIPQNLSQTPKAPHPDPIKRDSSKRLPVMDFLTDTVDESSTNTDEKLMDTIMPTIEIEKTDQVKQVKSDITEKLVNKVEPQILLYPKQVAYADQENNQDKSLDYEVENATGKVIYVAGFSYIKKRPFSRWRWEKTPVFKLENNQTTVINIDIIKDDEDRESVYGYLGVFDSEKTAQESTFELLDDRKKIDLDLLSQLKNKKVRIEIEKYGIVGEFYDYDFVKRSGKITQVPELDFTVENLTGKSVIVTCFVYQKKAKGTWLSQKTKESWTAQEDMRDDMSPWRFDKTSVIKINPGDKGEIDVDTIVEPRDRDYIRGYLVIFDENERKLADEATYELLPSYIQKLDLGRLINIKNNSIKIYTEKYGGSELVDYTVQAPQRPNFGKITKGIS